MDGRFDVRQEADSPFANMCFTDSSTVTRMLVSRHCLLELTKHKDGRISSTSNLKLCVRHCTTNVPFKNILARHNLKCFKSDTGFIFVCCDIFVLFVSLSHVFVVVSKLLCYEQTAKVTNELFSLNLDYIPQLFFYLHIYTNTYSLTQ